MRGRTQAGAPTAAALSALALAGAGAAGCIGDSRPARGVGSPAINTENIFFWATLYSRGLVRFEGDYAKAVAGSLTSDLDGQITTLLAAGTPAWCYVLTGTNDDATVSSLVQTSRIIGAWTRLMAAGIRPIHLTDPPRAQSGYTANQRLRNDGTNARLLRLGPTFGVPVYDTHRIMADTASATGDPLASLVADGVHHNDLGAKAIGGPAMGTDLLTRYGAGFYGADAPYSAGDRYDATYAPDGNLIKNAFMQGSGGTGGAGITGTIPTNVVVGVTNCTVVVSTAARTDGRPGNWLVLTITQGGSAGSWSVQFATDAPPPSKRGRFSVDLDVNFGSLASSGPEEVDVFTIYGPSFNFSPNAGGQGSVAPGSFVGRLFQLEHTIPANASFMHSDLEGNVGTAAGTRVVKIGAPAFRAF